MKQITLIGLVIGVIISSVCLRAEGAPNEEGERLIEEGVEFFEDSEFQGALSKFKKALTIFKENDYQEGTATALRNIGRAHRNLANYPEALKHLEQALEIDRRIANKKGEANDLTNLGVVYDSLANYPKALDCYEKALKIHREIGNRKGEAADLTNLGVLHFNLANYPKALECYQEALKIHKEIGNRKGQANVLTNIGLIHFNLADYPEALEKYEQALEIYREIGNRKGEADVLTNTGSVYWGLADYPEAFEHYEQALKICREIGDRKGEANVLTNVGVVYDDLASYPRALKCYEQALKTHRGIGDRKGEANVLTNVGLVYFNLGDYPKAIKYYEQALEIDREIDDQKGEAADLANIGVAYRNLGDYPGALQYYEKVLEIHKKIGLPTGIEEANIGDIYLEQGRLEEAFAVFERLNQLIRLGRYHLAKEDYGQARLEFARSLRQDKKRRKARFLLADYIGLGLAYEGLKDYPKARQYYRKAVDFIQRQRETLTESQRRYFFSGKVMGFRRLIPYEGLVRLSFHLKEEDRGFRWAEATKARLFIDAMAKGLQEKGRYGLPNRLLAKESELANGAASLYKQQEVTYRMGNSSRYGQIEVELSILKKRQQEFVMALRRDYPEYASIMYPEPVEPGRIGLRQDEVLIEYEVTSSETLAWLIRQGKVVKAISVPLIREELNEMVREYRSFFEDVATHSDLNRFDPLMGKALYELLLKDLLDPVKKGEKIIIVPDEILGILPFEILVRECPKEIRFSIGDYGPYPEGIRYVSDDYQISYYQSATALGLIRDLTKKRPKGKLLIVADPVFDESDPRIEKQEIAFLEKNEYQLSLMHAVEEDWNRSVKFKRLETGSQLARELKESLGQEVDILLGLSASEKELKRRGLDYDRLLFYTHGILDNTIPYIKEPALVLTLVGTRDKEDLSPGLLTMSEVMSLKTPARVALLTACSTGLGQNVSGEGVMGMGRAFQYAGAGSVLVSLWDVEPGSSSLLSKRFLIYLDQGKDNYEALNLARSELRRQGYQHPFYWASFILIGER